MSTVARRKHARRAKRRRRIRGKVAGTARAPAALGLPLEPRLFAQLIDDERGHTSPR
jgi:hypothetical protein